MRVAYSHFHFTRIRLAQRTLCVVHLLCRLRDGEADAHLARRDHLCRPAREARGQAQHHGDARLVGVGLGLGLGRG